MADNNIIQIFDTTLRDGEQSPGASLRTHEKIEIAHQLARLGADVIEAGFPISSPGDFDAVQRIAREVQGPTITALARAVKEDIDSVWNAIKDAPKKQIHLVLSVSDVHIERKLLSTRKEVLARGIEMVKYARSFCDEVEYSPEDAGRSDHDYLAETVEKVIEAGATCVNIPDTTGYCMPWEFGELIAMLFRNVRNIHQALISVHCHNDLGLATANSIAGIVNGARRIECTINGIGERAGNTSLEEVVMLLKTREKLLGLRTNIDTRQISRTSDMVSSLTSLPVQPNKAIVGANAFAHASGIHQDGVLKDRLNYEIMLPEDVGLTESKIVLSSRSGRHAFKYRLKELGYTLDGDAFNRAWDRFLALADQKKIITDVDLEAIVHDDIHITTETFRLDQIQVSCGDHSIPTASVQLTGPGNQVLSDAALGTGPVDAVYKAINRVVQIPNQLTEFTVKSVTEGIDAVGEVTIRIEHEGHSYVGRGADTDIIVASAKAYMNALNKSLIDKETGRSKLELTKVEQGHLSLAEMLSTTD